jgi:aminomethyltransferase
MVIDKLTQGYDRVEDRISIDVQDAAGRVVGRVSSGGFGPPLGGPLALAYVDSAHAAPGTALQAIVRERPRPMTVTRLPFVPQRYHRGAAVS